MFWTYAYSYWGRGRHEEEEEEEDEEEQDRGSGVETDGRGDWRGGGEMEKDVEEQVVTVTQEWLRHVRPNS